MIVVSNRLPFVLVRDKEGNLGRKPSVGGLVTAMASVIAKCKGLWVGWPGMHLPNENEHIPEADCDHSELTAGILSSQIVPVHILPVQLDGYYNGCCNRTFWPLFHSMPDRAVFKPSYWEAYCAVNHVFAERAIESIKSLQQARIHNRPLVWIHDFHLMVAAINVRQAMEDNPTMNCSLGFFLHIPFPPYDIFRICPWVDEILQGLLGHDLVGFHTETYALNFLQCCQKLLGCRVDKEKMLIEHSGRIVLVKVLPIGIPFERFASLSLKTKPLKDQNSGQKLILGVDRLDYTKGILNRVLAIEKLLEIYPQYTGKITFLQVAVPSRTQIKEYKALKDELAQETQRINKRFSRSEWIPIRCMYRYLPHDELATYYKDADVALVTPLRDGMNLVAKEFVACQTGKPGVLILSPFAGAGETMLESIVENPYDTIKTAHAIDRALRMPQNERRARMNLLRKREQEYDVHFWLDSFMQAMRTTMRINESDGRIMSPTKIEDFDAWMDVWMTRYLDDNSTKLALFLDYDGTLAPIEAHPDLAVLPNETKRVLERLSCISNVHVAIVSGRKLENVKRMVGIDKITYAGSHGLEILHQDGTNFTLPGLSQYIGKMADLRMRLVNELQRDGAWVEDKKFLLAYHVRNVKTKLRGEMLQRATELIAEFGFNPRKGHCVVEAKPPVEWDKGRACMHIMENIFNVDWKKRVGIIYAGDDETDEDAMKRLKGLALTLRITNSQPFVRTTACKRLHRPDSLLLILKSLERHMTRKRRDFQPENCLVSNASSRLSSSNNKQP